MFENSNVVYILGAGYSVDAGMPLLSSFINRMRDSWYWPSGFNKSGTDEAANIGRHQEALKALFKFKQESHQCAYWMNIDLDNIEELFSLALLEKDEELSHHIRYAIATTIEYCTRTSSQKLCRARLINPAFVKNYFTSTGNRGYFEKEDLIRLPQYEYLAGVMSGLFDSTEQLFFPSYSTVITFNYDTVLDDALNNLSLPYNYQLPWEKLVDPEKGEYPISGQAGALWLLKLHGSVNWWVENETGTINLIKNDSNTRKQGVSPFIVPPTWRKDISETLKGVWEIARYFLSKATHVVIIGYSMPPTDTHFKYLLSSGLKDNNSLRSIHFVNPDVSALEKRIRETFHPNLVSREKLRLFKGTTLEFFGNEEKMTEIGRNNSKLVTR